MNLSERPSNPQYITILVLEFLIQSHLLTPLSSFFTTGLRPSLAELRIGVALSMGDIPYQAFQHETPPATRCRVGVSVHRMHKHLRIPLTRYLSASLLLSVTHCSIPFEFELIQGPYPGKYATLKILGDTSAHRSQPTYYSSSGF